MNQIKTTITIEPMRPDVWRLRINTSTYNEAGARIGRDQKYATVKGSRDAAEMERYKRLLGQGVAQASQPAAQIARDVTAQAAVSDMTLGAYADGWLERRLLQAMEGQTARNIKGLVRLYIQPAFGHLKLATLCRDQIIDSKKILCPLYPDGKLLTICEEVCFLLRYWPFYFSVGLFHHRPGCGPRSLFPSWYRRH